jgi:hypothetical protein
VNYKFTDFKLYLPYTKFLVIIILFWSSINTGSKYITTDYLKQFTINNSVNYIRALLPYFFLLYYFFFRKFNKIYFNSSDIVFKLFFLFAIFQISGLVYNFNNVFEHYWVICLLAVIIFFNWVEKIKDEKLLNLIFLINKVAIITIFSIFIIITFKENVTTKNILYNSTAFNLLYNGELGPRSSGLSRMSLIIFIFFNAFYFANIFNKKINILILIINIMLISIMLLIQSRGVILCFFIIFLIINFVYEFKNFIHRLSYFILIFIIPLVIFGSYSIIKNKLIKNFHEEKTHTLNLTEIKLKDLIKLRSFSLEDKNYKEKIIVISNNRYWAWQFLIQIFFNNNYDNEIRKVIIESRYDPEGFNLYKKKNLLTGYGPQADRKFLKNSTYSESPRILGPFGHHASNGYVYSLICSGILGLVTFISLNLIIFFKLLKIFLKKKSSFLNSKPYLTSSILCIIFLQIRLLFENSFSVFGVDLLILLSSYLIIQNEYRKLKN